MKQPLLMPQVAVLTGGGTLTMVYNGTAWTKLGGGSGWCSGSTEIILNHCLKIIVGIVFWQKHTTFSFVGDSTSDLLGNASGLAG
jgi:hypothetical protein